MTIALQLDNFSPKIKVEKDKDGLITSGLCLGDTLRQNQSLILVYHKGELKERPEIGVGIEDMLLDDDVLFWKSTIREQLELDGQNVERIVLTTRGIDIKASY